MEDETADRLVSLQTAAASIRQKHALTNPNEA